MRLYEIVVPALAVALLAFVVMTQYGRVMHNLAHPGTTSMIPVATPVYRSLCGRENQNCRNLTFDTGLGPLTSAAPEARPTGGAARIIAPMPQTQPETSAAGDPSAGRPLPMMVRLWWIPLVRGIVAIGLGIAILSLDTGRPALVNFIALYWLVSSLLVLRVTLPHASMPGARLGVLAGALGVATAIMTLMRRWLGFSGEEIVIPLAVAIVLIGVVRIIGGFEVERRTGRRWTYGGLLLGGVEIALGVLLFASIWLGIGIEYVVGTAVIWAFVGGGLLVLDGLQARRISRHAPTAAETSGG